jgi:hypothetical protein
MRSAAGNIDQRAPVKPAAKPNRSHRLDERSGHATDQPSPGKVNDKHGHEVGAELRDQGRQATDGTGVQIAGHGHGHGLLLGKRGDAHPHAHDELLTSST